MQGGGTAACAMTGDEGAPLVLGGALLAMAIAVERRRRGGREARMAQRRSTMKTT
ncbi:MAG: hypothetical protein U0359_10660 [Byssovorax sp.]